MSDIEKGIELELKQFKGHYINLVKCENRLFDIARELSGDVYISPQFKSKDLAFYQNSPVIYKNNISELIAEEEELIKKRDYHLYAFKIVANYLQQLNQNEVTLVEMYYYKNFTQDEIAKKIFRSRSWVQQELQKIIEKLANL